MCRAARGERERTLAQREGACAERERALAVARRRLERREQTVAQLREALGAAGASPGTAETVLRELAAAGLIDDARYARLFAEDRRALDGWGRERIARALHARGIAPELIERALAQEGDGELERALGLLRARFPDGIGDPRARRRAYGLLARRGYDDELAARAVHRLAGGEEE